ncbi:MAG: sulfotransferase [Pseudomonadota bacterium]
MDQTIHFISGLPRSGSTLLSALLRQNPRYTAGMTSPVGHLFNAMLRETSMRHEDAVFLDDAVRVRLLRAVFESYYADVAPGGVIFDTNRMWTTKLAALSQLFPEAKIVCCVRNPAWVIDSIESLIRRNPFELSGIFSFEPGGTVFSRAEGLSGPAGMVGFAFNALKEAVWGPHADRLVLVRYESLVADPLATLRDIHAFLGLPMGAHDPKNIEPCYDMLEFDRRLGTPGLHDVGRKVQARTRKSVLPPELFAQHEAQAFWQDRAKCPEGLAII